MKPQEAFDVLEKQNLHNSTSMWLTPVKASGRKNVAPKIFMMAKLKRGHCTSRSIVLAAPPAMVKDKSGEGGQTAVRLDPIYDGVQPDILQRGRAVTACRRSKSQEVRAATWNVSSMVCRLEEILTSVVLKRRDGRVEARGYLVLLVEDTSCFGRAVIRRLLVLVCLLVRDGLTVLSMWSESMSRSFM